MIRRCVTYDASNNTFVVNGELLGPSQVGVWLVRVEIIYSGNLLDGGGGLITLGNQVGA